MLIESSKEKMTKMGRLIDEDEVFAEIDRHKAWIEKHYEEKGIEDGFAEMYLLAHDHIKEAIQVKVPSAQPGIIHCRDCKHWKKTYGDERWSVGDCDVFDKKLVMCKGFCA